MIVLFILGNNKHNKKMVYERCLGGSEGQLYNDALCVYYDA